MTSLALPQPGLREDATVIGLVGLAHGVSHFSQLLLAPLFPQLKEAFGVSYAELGFLMTLFFATSCVVQAVSGFWVDRHGPRPVLLAGLGVLGLAALGFAASPGYGAMALCSVLAGAGNGVFHPVDYTLLNRKIAPARLGHAYSAHGISGSLGWALAPAVLVPLALAYSWRVALAAAALLAFSVLALLWARREHLLLPAAPTPKPAAGGVPAAGAFGFLRIPSVWMCFGFFFVYAAALSVVQTFAPEAARVLHGVPASMVAICLTAYMLCSAGGMVIGGFLAAAPQRSERVVGAAFTLAAAAALTVGFVDVPPMAVPVLFGAIGLCSGLSGPSRDLLVKRATPVQASGRVYGVVYAGLDIGQAVVPLGVGLLMDQGAYRSVWGALALMQTLLIFTAFRVGRVRRAPLAPA
jgi:MFS family permease